MRLIIIWYTVCICVIIKFVRALFRLNFIFAAATPTQYTIQKSLRRSKPIYYTEGSFFDKPDAGLTDPTAMAARERPVLRDSSSTLRATRQMCTTMHLKEFHSHIRDGGAPSAAASGVSA